MLLTSPQGFNYRGAYKTAKVPPCKLSVEDLRRLHAELAKAAKQAVETLIANAKQPADVSNEVYAERIAALRAVAGPVIRVYGGAGEHSAGLDVGLLDDLPEHLAEIHFESAAALQSAYNVTPLNRFTVVFDFTEPPVGHTNNAANEPTPNKSAITVVGDDTNWVRGVYSGVMDFLQDGKRKRPWGWLHSTAMFNLSMLFVAIPAAMWLGHRVDSFVVQHWPSTHVILRVAIFLYTGMIALKLYHAMLGTLRWAFPVVEIERSRTWRTRTLVVGFVGGLLYALVQDVFTRLVLE